MDNLVTVSLMFKYLPYQTSRFVDWQHIQQFLFLVKDHTIQREPLQVFAASGAKTVVVGQ